MKKKLFEFYNVAVNGEAILTRVIHSTDAERDKEFKAYKEQIKQKYPNHTAAWMERK